ncbi:MAG: hypothetical protein HC836_45600 [Richelia sp. RM2_1_2]|nr:hypothetical protein [Richelia sp. RM2_1_2]
MELSRKIKIVSTKEFLEEVKVRGARVNFSELLSVAGLGRILAITKSIRVETFPNHYVDIDYFIIKDTDAESMINYMIDKNK